MPVAGGECVFSAVGESMTLALLHGLTTAAWEARTGEGVATACAAWPAVVFCGDGVACGGDVVVLGDASACGGRKRLVRLSVFPARVSVAGSAADMPDGVHTLGEAGVDTLGEYAAARSCWHCHSAAACSAAMLLARGEDTPALPFPLELVTWPIFASCAACSRVRFAVKAASRAAAAARASASLAIAAAAAASAAAAVASAVSIDTAPSGSAPSASSRRWACTCHVASRAGGDDVGGNTARGTTEFSGRACPTGR